MTSFVLADFLTDNGCFGATTVVISSASSKTSYGTAFLLDGVHRVGPHQRRQPRLHRGPGLLRRGADLRRGRGAGRGPAVYVDVAGDAALRRRVHERLAPVHSAVVGAAHHDAAPDLAGRDDLPGARRRSSSPPTRCASATPTGAPTGSSCATPRPGPGSRPVVAGWVDVTVGTGPDGLDAAWREVLAGATPPRNGHVIQL